MQRKKAVQDEMCLPGQIRLAYERELQFLHFVQMGDVKGVQELIERNAIEIYLHDQNTLSTNAVRNMRYQIIIMASLLSRYCIEAGMHIEMAGHLNSLYIRQADMMMDMGELKRLNDRMLLDYTRRMLAMRKEKVFSQNVARCIDYIYAHIGDRITAQELAVYCKLHPSYLSRLFREEVGIGINEYIRKVKVESAKNMLKYSDDSYLTIANNLSFASQSHFVKVFREQTGMTPKSYRDKYYRKGMGSPDEDILFSQY